MARQSNKLDDKTIKSLTHNPEKGAKNKYYDGGGLYLLVKKGNSKYWYMDYRNPLTRLASTLSFGDYPTVTLKQARIKRDEAKIQLKNDKDPNEESKKIKAKNKADLENTFEKYANEWLKTRELEGKVDRETIRKLNHDILPYIGNMPVIHLTVEQLERDVTARMVEREALESARRVKSIMNMVLKLPLKRRVITYNPAPDITLPKPTKKNHNAVTDEKELGEMLRKMWQLRKISPRTRARTEMALKLSAYIFQRPNEIRELLWEHVDFENHRLCFRASKTHQEHIVPLSRQAFDLLKQAEELRTTSKYVFPSSKTNKECMSEGTILGALKRIGYQGKHTHHGFRATARTITDEEMEIPSDIIEHQLAHTVRDPNGTAYNRTKKIRRRVEVMQTWADYLDTLRQGGDVSIFKQQSTNENLIQFPIEKTA